jgi:hypothetical protein
VVGTGVSVGVADDTGGDGVDPDALRTEFRGPGAGQGLHRGLGRGVERADRDAEPATYELRLMITPPPLAIMVGTVAVPFAVNVTTRR